VLSPGPAERTFHSLVADLDQKAKSFGCGYFLATRKALKNQAILRNLAEEMVEKSGVIELKTAYPWV
jgi:hypothetical protein